MIVMSGHVGEKQICVAESETSLYRKRENVSDMRELQYADAGMDMKKYMLCLFKKIPFVLVTAVLGAMLGALVYTVVRTVPEAEREYSAFSKIYLDFAADETGEIYQEYNGYTWNDLMVTDPILDLTMANLSADYAREEVMAATEATILSDLRLLTVTITTHNAERTDAILAATDRALESYGKQAKEFIEVQTIQTTQAKLVVADSRMVQAVLVGLLIGLVLSLIILNLYYVMDDRIRVASDVRKVTNMSFLGYLSAGDIFEKDYKNHMAYLKERLGNIQVYDAVQEVPLQGEKLEELRRADGVVLTVPYGKMHGTYLSYLLEQLATQECNVCGVAIRDADEKFLRMYYGGIKA